MTHKSESTYSIHSTYLLVKEKNRIYDDHVPINSLPALTALCGFGQFTAKFPPITIRDNGTRCYLSYIKCQEFSPHYITLPN